MKSCRYAIVVFIVCIGIINILSTSVKAQEIIPTQEAQVTGRDSVMGELNRLAGQQDRKWLPEFNNYQENYSLNKEVPDSMYETNNDGYITEAFRWYFYYNDNYRLDSSKRLYYTAKGQYENITELRIYYPDGKISKLISEQPEYSYVSFSTDSTILPVSTKEYYYDNNGNLVRQFNDDLSGYYGYADTLIFNIDTSTYYYNYDSYNRLISETTYYKEYYYYYGDSLKYQTILMDGMYLGTAKYVYTVTDSTSTVTEYYVQFPNNTQQVDPDTISNWSYIEVYTNKYDQAGRVESLVHREIFSALGYPAHPDYKAEYTYTGDNQLLHASYYTRGTPDDTAAWYEAMRIDNSYDNKGYLTDYRKTFRDDRLGSWQIQESKTYYYSTVPVVAAVKNTTVNDLDISPNPAHSSFMIRGLKYQSCRYIIYTLYGEVIQSGRLNKPEINISQLKQGMYILEIRNEASVFSGKFVKY